MRPPEIEGALFLAACGLIAAPGTIEEVFDRLGWETTKANLIRALSVLRDRGLVEAGTMTRRGDDGTLSKPYGYRLTDDGSRAVVETIDNYLFIAKRFTPSPDIDDDGIPETIDFDVCEDRSDRPPSDEHPTPEQLVILVKHATDDLEGPCRLILAFELKAVVVCGLTVRDFDRMTGALNVGGRMITLPLELRDMVAAAIGGREAGPLFIRRGLRKGRAWTAPALADAFRNARDAAGLPNNLVLIGRKYNHLGGQRQSSQATDDPYRE